MQMTIEKQVLKKIPNKFKKCDFCSEIINVDAKKCKHCGEFLDPKLRETPASPKLKWNPVYAALLSLLFPGGGHIYRNKPLKGFLWLVFSALGYGFYIVPGIFLHSFSILFAVLGNPLEE